MFDSRIFSVLSLLFSYLYKAKLSAQIMIEAGRRQLEIMGKNQ